MNLGLHVGDESSAVQVNRARMHERLGARPVFLDQVHGTNTVQIHQDTPDACRADGAITRETDLACTVMVADCLPVLLTDRQGALVAAAHAGWRGLLAGVIEATIRGMRVPDGRLLAWLGPAIGPSAFEVGDEVRSAFLAADDAALSCFVPSPGGRWLADLYGLARQRLAAAGVSQVSGGDCCTYADGGRFFSYRRDGVTGRMATLIWKEAA